MAAGFLKKKIDSRDRREQYILRLTFLIGELAQLGEHLPCKQGVRGSNPLFSTVIELGLQTVP